MMNSENALLTSGIVLFILLSATIITFTSKYILVPVKPKKPTNQIYDLDHGLNITSICLLSKNAYAISYETSICSNKTLVQWYNPWLRHELWTGFWNEIKAKNRRKELQMTQAANKTEIPLQNETVLPTELPKVKETAEVPKEKEKPIEFVYSILVGLLIISGLVACWEVFKDKMKKEEGAAAKAQERQCSLADFTINRHLRRESQQQFSNLPRQGSLELTAKVTQNLIHQSSLDRAFPKTISEVITSESRRNSVPLYLSSDVSPGQTAGTPSTPKLKSMKRQSVDVPGEEFCLDLKKKPRHFIRRH